MTTSAPGATVDFGFLAGVWSVRHRRLRTPLSGRDDWYEFDGTARAQALLDGGVSVDEIDLTGGVAGMSVRLRNPATDEWTIYWVSSRDGRLQAPVVGRWADGVFEAYGDDEYDGRPLRARYIWSGITQTTARWEQAFSVDGAASWETNWIMDWRRDPDGSSV